MRRTIVGLSGAIVGLLLYLLLYPVSGDPVAWSLPPPMPLEGALSPNLVLAEVSRVAEGAGEGPEDIVFDDERHFYAGYADGRILRFSPDGNDFAEFANTGGRPLGLRFDTQGALIVADAVRGLLRIWPNGASEVLSTEAGGRPFRFVDDLDIAADGRVYFTDASFKHGPEDYVTDLLEHRPNGRLLVFEPQRETTRVAVDNLYFANGVAVDPQQAFVLVTETGKYRVLRYWLSGEKTGQVDTFIANLPGFPDNISAGPNGTFWLALAAPRTAMLDGLMPYPFLRKLILRLPRLLHPAPPRYGHVLELDREGNILRSLQDPEGVYAPITSAEEHEGHLYLGSIEEDSIGRLALPAPPESSMK